MQIGIWLYSFSFPKVRSCALKKSSFVLALTLKKYKLKSNRNISLVQSMWPGISSAIVTSSYHALSRADGRVYTEAWLRSLGIAESVLGSNPLLVTILGSWKYGSYMWASFSLLSGSKRHCKMVSEALLCGQPSSPALVADRLESLSCQQWKTWTNYLECKQRCSSLKKGFCDYHFGRWALFWGVGEGVYIQDLEELWTDCQWYPSLASPHPAFENVRGKMLQKLLQPFVVLLEKERKGLCYHH